VYITVDIYMCKSVLIKFLIRFEDRLFLKTDLCEFFSTFRG
jgi:hypothetical protein